MRLMQESAGAASFSPKADISVSHLSFQFGGMSWGGNSCEELLGGGVLQGDGHCIVVRYGGIDNSTGAQVVPKTLAGRRMEK